MRHYGTIKNPLTIIAIFAGIAEVSGTLVLPFISAANQQTFIYFLMGFPILLILLFFATLNFNHKVLYAPSDYENEDNFVKLSKFDFSKQRMIEVEVQKKDIAPINKNIKVQAVDFSNVKKFKEFMKKSNIQVSVYNTQFSTQEKIPAVEEHNAIWLGINVPIEIAKKVLLKSKSFYPHLEYIHISDDSRGAPVHIMNEIFIGGAFSTVKEYKLKPIPKKDWLKIEKISTKEELHKFVMNYS